jgi:uncharacterized protein (DUF362 family)
MSEVSKVCFTDYGASIAKALDVIGAGGTLTSHGLVIIKPNLTNADGPPVTTSVAAAEAVYEYCRSHCKTEMTKTKGFRHR